jgi:hypothetical protein
MTTSSDRNRLAVPLAERFSYVLSQARSDLYENSKLHADFVGRCIEVLEAKTERLQGPLLGEVFPHLVAEGLQLPDLDRRTLAAAWLAIYGYISLVDYELDQKGHLNARESIAASALLGWGIATLARYTAGTRFQETFIENINRAFSGQYEDLRSREINDADRQNSDVEKNRASVMVAAAYCAAAGETDDRLVLATESLLSAFQILDDLEDVQEDNNEHNITAFVRIVRQCASTARALQRTDVYRAVIADPSTQRLLERAVNAFEQSLLLLKIEKDQSLIAFICEMKARTIDLISVLDDYQINPSPVKEPEVLKKIDLIIASS